MFYVAKVVQALGVADVGYALFVGVTQRASMGQELVLALIGVALFSLGRALEKRTV